MRHFKISGFTIAILLFIQNFPLLWLFITSITSETGLFTLNNRVLSALTLSNFSHLFSKYNFLLWLRNSLLLSIFAATIATIFGWFFSLSVQLFVPSFFQRLKALLLVAYLIPNMFLVLALQQLLDRISGLGLLVTLGFCYQFFLLPVSVWISSSYVSRIPKSLIALSCMDELRLLERIRLIAKPFVVKGISAVFSLCFVLAFQEYLYALVFLKEENLLTIPLGLTSLQAGDVYEWGVIAAGSISTSLLIIVILIIFGGKVGSAIRNFGERALN
jgi:ABC-type glycerol-3-phosphate transport system permease component